MQTHRIHSIDLLRGWVIVIMALDHVHDFFGDLAAQPTNLTTTTAALFFTRWITHLCAPVFSLLTGTGAYLAGARMSKPRLSRFLCTRGSCTHQEFSSIQGDQLWLCHTCSYRGSV